MCCTPNTWKVKLNPRNAAGMVWAAGAVLADAGTALLDAEATSGVASSANRPAQCLSALKTHTSNLFPGKSKCLLLTKQHQPKMLELSAKVHLFGGGGITGGAARHGGGKAAVPDTAGALLGDVVVSLRPTMQCWQTLTAL